MEIIYRCLAEEEDDFLLTNPVETVRWHGPVLAGIQGSSIS